MTHDLVGDERRQDLPQRLALLVLWSAVSGYLIWHHVFWRDEVRALSLALNGDSWVAMLRGVQGDGHPGLWYLLLRAAHDLVPVREVLPVMAGIVGFGAAAMLVMRSPFSPLRIASILFGAFFVFEYTVMARNYGISMLLLFVIADRYTKHRDSGVMLGLLLFLLCNTNVHSAFLAAALLLFWAIELLSEDGWSWTPRVTTFAVNAGIAAVGAALCAITIYPPVNDAAVNVHPGGVGPTDIVHALLLPAQAFPDMMPYFFNGQSWMAPVLALALIGAPFGLIRSPGAFLSSFAVIAVFQAFFYVVYPGGYRHQSLYLVYLIVMYWLVALGRGGQWRSQTATLAMPEKIGRVLFALLLVLQLISTVAYLKASINNLPESRSRDLAAVLHIHGLDRRAILIANADPILESMPYYTTNRLYFVRSARFGTISPINKSTIKTISLGDMTTTMRQLHARYGVPVVAVLQYRLDQAAPAVVIDQGYIGSFAITPEQVRAFRAATTRIASFGPTISDESYDVYVMR
ncbi:hypothetical protein [Sphingomonas sp. GB1N7]|uniref:hypothetical protein n=1 Tax=Parasphingomonas caseinilytica TaxID=3096158 RepID=UPI002FC662E5